MLMRYWYSPLPLDKDLAPQLLAAGLTKFCTGSLDYPGDTLILYETPDAVLRSARHHAKSMPTLQCMIDYYEHIQSCCGKHTVIATWRLEAMNSHEILAWLNNENEQPLASAYPAIDSVNALVMQGILKSEPRLLDAYLNVELKANLAGGESDSEYLLRLDKSCIDAEELIDCWWRPYGQIQSLTSENERQSLRTEVLEKSCRETSEQADLTLFQLHQLQEELENIIRDDQDKQKQINGLKEQSSSQSAILQNTEKAYSKLKKECMAANQGMEMSLRETAKLKQETWAKNNLISQLREDLDLTMSQLHLAQEEAEQALHKANNSCQLVAAQQQELQRSQEMISRLLTGNHSAEPSLSTERMENFPTVLTPDSTQDNTSLQQQALLRTYAYSLQRASALLQRMNG